MEFATLPKSKSRGKKVSMLKRASIGADLQHLDADKFITTDPRDYSKRRTLKLIKRANSWGFTLQTYGIKHKRTNEVEVMTYVDYVEIGGAAWIAGMRAGDVIRSVNGERVDQLSHQELVARIRNVQDTLRLVVLFEDCCKKVELHERFLKLKAVLRAKVQELKDLERKEIELIENYCKTKDISRFDELRQSILSKVSSNSDSWDAYSMVSSPNNQHSTGHYKQGMWSSVSSLKSFSMEDNNSSIAEEDYLNFIDYESDTESLGQLPLGRSSDSDLPSKVTAAEHHSLKVKHELVMSSSDSDLYRGKSALKGPTHRKTSGHGPKKLEDEVFINGASGSEKGSNSNVVKVDNSNWIKGRDSDMTEVQSAGKADKCNGAKSEDLNSGRDTSKIFYAGDNGNIIVPKIVVEGDEIFTTFDHIDTKMIEEKGLPSLDPDSYRDKVVALEIAREMALFENMNGVNNPDTDEVSDTFDLETRSPNSVRKSDQSFKASQNKNSDSSLEKNSKNSQDQNTETSLEKNSKTSQDNLKSTQDKTTKTSQDKNSEISKQKTGQGSPRQPAIRKANSLVARETKLSVFNKSPTLSTRSLTRNSSDTPVVQGLPRLIGKYTSSFSSSAPHICGSLSYEQLKSSVPDFVISFHTDKCQVIYINEKDESTKL